MKIQNKGNNKKLVEKEGQENEESIDKYNICNSNNSNINNR